MKHLRLRYQNKATTIISNEIFVGIKCLEFHDKSILVRVQKGLAVQYQSFFHNVSFM